MVVFFLWTEQPMDSFYTEWEGNWVLMKQGYDFISTELILSLLTYFWMSKWAFVLFPNQDTILLLPTCVNLIYAMKSKGHTCALLVFSATLFSIFLTRLNFHSIHTGTDGLGKPAIAWICVAVGIVLVAASIASILAYIQKGTPVRHRRGRNSDIHSDLWWVSNGNRSIRNWNDVKLNI